jgi:hypothetical protein
MSGGWVYIMTNRPNVIVCIGHHARHNSVGPVNFESERSVEHLRRADFD